MNGLVVMMMMMILYLLLLMLWFSHKFFVICVNKFGYVCVFVCVSFLLCVCVCVIFLLLKSKPIHLARRHRFRTDGSLQDERVTIHTTNF